MSARHPWRPTDRQQLLLRAALCGGPESVTAWRAWTAELDWDSIDEASQRLLPLVYRNLAHHGERDPQMARLKGVYRQTWYSNQILTSRVAPLLVALQAAGIPTLLLKGASLAPYYHGDFGLRPMHDFDVLVPTTQARDAVAVLVASGWTPLHGVAADRVIRREIPRMHGWGFRDREGRVVDLHWHVLHDSLMPGDDADFWEASRPARVSGLEARTLCPSDMLLHVLFHGARFEGERHLRWVADAVRILDVAGPEIDWDRFERLATRKRIRLPLADTLGYLAGAFAAPVPEGLVARLRRGGQNLAEWIEYRVTVRPHRLSGPLSETLLTYRRYVRWRLRHGRSGPLAVAAFAKDVWGVARIRGLPIHALSLLFRRPWMLPAGLSRRARRPVDRSAVSYTPGEVLFFTSGGMGATHTGIGWSDPEETGTWTEGREARLFLALPSPRHATFRLSILLTAFLPDERPSLDVDVVVNDERLARWRFRHPANLSQRLLSLPAAVVSRCDPLEIMFYIRNPRSPAALGIRGDIRRLGLHVHSLALLPGVGDPAAEPATDQSGEDATAAASSPIRRRRSSLVSLNLS